PRRLNRGPAQRRATRRGSPLVADSWCASATMSLAERTALFRDDVPPPSRRPCDEFIGGTGPRHSVAVEHRARSRAAPGQVRAIRSRREPHPDGARDPFRGREMAREPWVIPVFILDTAASKLAD